MTETTSDRYDISSLPRPGSPEMSTLPKREPIGKEPFRPSREFGPYATEWARSDWSPRRLGTPYKGHLGDSTGKATGTKAQRIEKSPPLDQISDRRRYFRTKLAKIQDTIEVCKRSNLERSRVPYLELDANETQFRIDELDVMQEFWPSISLETKSQIVDVDFVNEVAKARATRTAEKVHKAKGREPKRFAKPGETAFVSNGIRPTNAIERGEDDSYWEQENN